MRVRIISGVVGAALLIAVLACPWTIVLSVCLAVMAAIAVWELLHNTGKVPDKWLVFGGMIFAAVEVLAISDLFSYENSGIGTLLLIFLPMLFGVYSLLLAVFRHAKVDVMSVCYGFAMCLYVTLGFGSLNFLRQGFSNTDGLFYLLLSLLIPWMSDTGAYFVGTFLGKHKMTPVISPKKSWEGFFGGWIISVAICLLAGYLCTVFVPTVTVNYVYLALAALVLAPLSVCGDLFASVIKRQCDIKDYGNIMPGHGGVMDRFDSVVFIAPMVMMFVLFFPIV